MIFNKIVVVFFFEKVKDNFKNRRNFVKELIFKIIYICNYLYIMCMQRQILDQKAIISLRPVWFEITRVNVLHMFFFFQTTWKSINKYIYILYVLMCHKYKTSNTKIKSMFILSSFIFCKETLMWLTVFGYK